MKTSVLTIGGSGLVGSRLNELLSKAYDFSDLSSTSGLDITDKNSTIEKIKDSKAGVVILLAAKTNVDACEEDKERDKNILDFASSSEKNETWLKEKTAWAINVYGAQNVVDACRESGKKLIYVSTDFVFDGKKRSYSEDDIPNPINWYGKTKFEGEKIVQNSNLNWIIARIAYPYRAIHKKNDFARAILGKLTKREVVNAITDHIMVPTFIDDIVNAIDVLIQKDEAGIFHLVGSQAITPYDAAVKIAREFDLDDNLIHKTTRKEYFAGKAQRPFCLNLKNDKIALLGVEISSLDQGIKEIKNQMELINS